MCCLKTYDELIELASKGDNSNVDQYSLEQFESDNISDDEEDNIYKQRHKAGGGWMICFGKAVERRPGKNLKA
jgi:pantothenate kinase